MPSPPSIFVSSRTPICRSSMRMLGATLYLVGRDAKTNELIDAAPCSLCRRFILNAGIARVVSRTKEDCISIVDVADYIAQDDSLPDIKKL